MMSEIQRLLDESAKLQNEAYHNNTVADVSELYNRIKELRGTTPMPCWGEDDCSTKMLSTCPWRIDCGS